VQTVSTPSGTDLFAQPAVWEHGGETWMFAADNNGTAAWAVENVLSHGGLDGDVVARLARDCVGMSAGAKRGWVELGMGRDCRGSVRDVAARLGEQGTLEGFGVRVLVGREDKVETVERVEKQTVHVLRELGFTVSVSAIAGVGHLVPVEAPEEVVLALGKLLQGGVGG